MLFWSMLLQPGVEMDVVLQELLRLSSTYHSYLDS